MPGFFFVFGFGAEKHDDALVYRRHWRPDRGAEGAFCLSAHRPLLEIHHFTKPYGCVIFPKNAARAHRVSPMAEPRFAPFLNELANLLELPASSQKQLADFWFRVLEPHASPVLLRILQRNSERLRIFEPDIVGHLTDLTYRERAKLGRVFLVEVVSRSLTSDNPPSRLFTQTFQPPHFVPIGHIGTQKRKSRSPERIDEDEAQTIVLLRTISDALKATAQELAASNDKIEELLARTMPRDSETRPRELSKLTESKADDGSRPSS
jgi:hypothetical protein